MSAPGMITSVWKGEPVTPSEGYDSSFLVADDGVIIKVDTVGTIPGPVLLKMIHNALAHFKRKRNHGWTPEVGG